MCDVTEREAGCLREQVHCAGARRPCEVATCPRGVEPHPVCQAKVKEQLRRHSAVFRVQLATLPLSTGSSSLLQILQATQLPWGL